MEAARSVVFQALAACDRALDPRLEARAGARFPTAARARVLTYAELTQQAGLGRGEDPLGESPPGRDPRAATLERLRRLCQAAGVTGPAVILHLLPPYYPPAAPGGGPLSLAASRLAASEAGIALRDHYPFISDASYVSWRAESIDTLAPYFPSLNHEYHLPADEALALDLDVVTLGPWGRDAHGLFERVFAPYAFERLPGLITRLVREALLG